MLSGLGLAAEQGGLGGVRGARGLPGAFQGKTPVLDGSIPPSHR